MFGYLVKPFRESDLLPAIRAARARHAELETLREEAESLAEALATRKVVERAKGLLMEREGLSEQEAFARLRRASQSANRPMKVVAEASSPPSPSRPAGRAVSARFHDEAGTSRHTLARLSSIAFRMGSATPRGGPGRRARSSACDDSAMRLRAVPFTECCPLPSGTSLPSAGRGSPTSRVRSPARPEPDRRQAPAGRLLPTASGTRPSRSSPSTTPSHRWARRARPRRALREARARAGARGDLGADVVYVGGGNTANTLAVCSSARRRRGSREAWSAASLAGRAPAELLVSGTAPPTRLARSRASRRAGFWPGKLLPAPSTIGEAGPVAGLPSAVAERPPGRVRRRTTPSPSTSAARS